MKLSNKELEKYYFGALYFAETADGYLQAFQYTQPQIFLCFSSAAQLSRFHIQHPSDPACSPKARSLPWSGPLRVHKECSPHRSRGCPYCCNHVKIPGFNDIGSKYPELTKEWDYEKNKKLPSEYASGSDAKVWWRCEKGHSWRAAINSRVKSNGCPYCGNKKVLAGFNDLFTANP